MMKQVTIGLFIAAFLICTGCAGKYPCREASELDKNWGKSFKSIKENQVLNPDAGRNLEPVTGMDGESAEVVVDQYHESFKGASAGPDHQEYRLDLGTTSTVTQN